MWRILCRCEEVWQAMPKSGWRMVIMVLLVLLQPGLSPIPKETVCQSSPKARREVLPGRKRFGTTGVYWGTLQARFTFYSLMGHSLAWETVPRITEEPSRAWWGKSEWACSYRFNIVHWTDCCICYIPRRGTCYNQNLTPKRRTSSSKALWIYIDRPIP